MMLNIDKSSICS